ncbi:hypothetical protein LSAT2_030684 [Lamellibrachia satsuma]|nr:hypothetical protein LSAT2_030684 [Lamellibrachia satsuma]
MLAVRRSSWSPDIIHHATAIPLTNAKAQALAGGLAGHSAGRDARNAKPGRQQDDDTLPAHVNLSAPRCYYCHRKFSQTNDILAHLSDEHPTKDITILKPHYVLQTGRVRYRTLRYGIKWLDVAGGAASLILVPHSWLLVGRDNFKRVDRADSGVGLPSSNGGRRLPPSVATKRTSSGRKKRVYWRTKVKSEGASRETKIQSSPASGAKSAVWTNACKPGDITATVVFDKPNNAAKSALFGKPGSAAASVVSSKQDNTSATVVSGMPTSAAKKANPVSVVSAKPVSTTEKAGSVSMVFAKPVSTTEKAGPLNVLFTKPVSRPKNEKSGPVIVMSAKPISTTEHADTMSVVSIKPVSVPTNEKDGPVSVVSCQPVSKPTSEKDGPVNVVSCQPVSKPTSEKDGPVNVVSCQPVSKPTNDKDGPVSVVSCKPVSKPTNEEVGPVSVVSCKPVSKPTNEKVGPVSVVSCQPVSKPTNEKDGPVSVVSCKPVSKPTNEKGGPVSVVSCKPVSKPTNDKGGPVSVVSCKPVSTPTNEKGGPVSVVSCKPVSKPTNEKGGPVSVVSCKPVSKPTNEKGGPVSIVSCQPVSKPTNEKDGPVSVVSCKPVSKPTNDKDGPVSVVSCKPVSKPTNEKGGPVSVVSCQPVSKPTNEKGGLGTVVSYNAADLAGAVSFASDKWDDDFTFIYRESNNFVSPRTMSPQCTPVPLNSGTSTDPWLYCDIQTSTCTFDGSAVNGTVSGTRSNDIRKHTVDNSTSTIPGYDVTRDGSMASGVYFSEDTSRQFSPGKDVPPPRKCRTTSGRYMSNDIKMQLPDSVVRGLENMSMDTVNPAKCLLARGTSFTNKKVCSEVGIPMLSRVLLANAVRAGDSEQTTASGNSTNHKSSSGKPANRTSDNRANAESLFWKDMNYVRFGEPLDVKQHVTQVGHSQSQKDPRQKETMDDHLSDDGLGTWPWEESRALAADSTGTTKDCPCDEPDTIAIRSNFTTSERDPHNPTYVKYNLGCEQDNVKNTTDELPLCGKETPQYEIGATPTKTEMCSYNGAATTGGLDNFMSPKLKSLEFASANNDTIYHCCSESEQFVCKKISAEPEDDDVTALMDVLSESHTLKWLFREDSDDNDDVTDAEPTPIRFFVMDESIADEMMALFPSVVPLLRSAGRLADWLHFMQLLADDRCFPPSDDAHELFADVRRWQNPDCRAYTDGQKRFWTLGNRLFRAHSDFQASKVGSHTEQSWDTFDE